MTTAVSRPTAYVSFFQRPATFAQKKFSDKFWEEAVGYITAVAFAALAFFVNAIVFASPLQLIVANTALFAAGYNLVMPLVASAFADARKAQRQGEKEMLIDAKMTELQRLDNEAITRMLTDRGIQHNPGCQYTVTPEVRSIAHFDHKLARVIYYENRATALTSTSAQLKAENKFIESAEAEIAAHKAKVKAAFFASLIPSTRHGFSKFNDAFTWSDMSIADRLARKAANHPSGLHLLERKGDAAKVLTEPELNGTLGEIGNRLTAMLPNQPAPITY